ncbi:HEAT repeat domain-containing protein [Myxococcus qinghaiensis]|uniref:HEAT repeat domain-containing protein n=1 Tax=Myxococcus qinghaiensis TaxID=2906758 RepID=UPI0020A79C7F|nr:HEAT repeat domain-containing protein [Myxococcus qinghaiensis]MCP3166333.1 HEAT repeat domain-containing protein [Myxococcus qinghaiensis]
MSEPLTTLELLRQLAGAKTGGFTESIARLRARTDLVDAARAALSSGQEVERVLALLAMRGLEAREAHDLILSALGDASAQVRAMAAGGLALAPRQVAWGRLVQALADVDSTVRRQALETLVRIDTSAAGALLAERFAHATESERLTLLEVASEEATPAWLPLARQGLADATPSVRVAAVEVMSAVEGPIADRALMAALQDVDEQVRIAAVEALTPRDTLLEEPFLALLADGSPAVRMRALQALLRRGTTEGVEALIPLLEDPAPQLRKLAILAIGQLGCGAAIPRLIDEARRATDEEERASLVTALGVLGAREGESVLQAALQDASARVRTSAVVAWPRIVGASRALAPLRGLLRGDPDWQVRSQAALALTGAASAADADLAVALTRDVDPRVRSAAAGVLADRVGAEVEEALVKALSDPEPEVRLKAARALGRRLAAAARPALLALEATEPRRDVRAEVRLALSRLEQDQTGVEDDARPERELFDPAGLGLAFATWLRDPDWYPVSDRLVFYREGELESIDLEEQVLVHDYSVDVGHLRLRRPGTPELLTAFRVERTTWPTSEQGAQPCYRLELHTDVLTGSGHPRVFYCFDVG